MFGNESAIAVEVDLLGVRDIAPGLVQLALTLAAIMDKGGNATALANTGRELRTVMETLRKLAPVKVEDDDVDQLLQEGVERRVRARRT
ncbi:hypothetical protein [Streptomyces sp. NPDC051684]|uniref:hypothetical protein n=1 Tax=Streptomyces sp. NPDC051684 TaxID=3365670 RepID=UPI0037A7D733